jgi:hypothetical protein
MDVHGSQSVFFAQDQAWFTHKKSNSLNLLWKSAVSTGRFSCIFSVYPFGGMEYMLWNTSLYDAGHMLA